jgi:hypothetical protein
MDVTLSLLRFVATSGNIGSCSDFKECHMTITGGLEMPEGQLEVSAADVIQARRNRMVLEKRIAWYGEKAAAMNREYHCHRDPAVRADRFV